MFEQQLPVLLAGTGHSKIGSLFPRQLLVLGVWLCRAGDELLLWGNTRTTARLSHRAESRAASQTGCLGWSFDQEGRGHVKAERQGTCRNEGAASRQRLSELRHEGRELHRRTDPSDPDAQVPPVGSPAVSTEQSERLRVADAEAASDVD